MKLYIKHNRSKDVVVADKIIEKLYGDMYNIVESLKRKDNKELGDILAKFIERILRKTEGYSETAFNRVLTSLISFINRYTPNIYVKLISEIPRNYPNYHGYSRILMVIRGRKKNRGTMKIPVKNSKIIGWIVINYEPEKEEIILRGKTKLVNMNTGEILRYIPIEEEATINRVKNIYTEFIPKD